MLVKEALLISYLETYAHDLSFAVLWFSTGEGYPYPSGPTLIKPDQFDPWIKDQLGNALLPPILPLQLQNFVSRGRACPSHITQSLVTVWKKLLTGESFLFDP